MKRKLLITLSMLGVLVTGTLQLTFAGYSQCAADCVEEYIICSEAFGTPCTGLRTWCLAQC